MASLREVQLAFADAVLFDKTARIATMIVADGIAAAERVGIYRNNCRIGFATTLAAEFPVVQQLGGADWFDQVARRYQQQHPSSSGNLHHIGELFAAYLAKELHGSEYAYFSDVARLEWAYQEVLVAADHDDLDLNRLSCVSPGEYGSLQFTLHPAVRLIASRYPILKIWQAHQDKAAVSDAITFDLHSGGEQVVIVRRDTHVELRALPLGEYLLLEAFARGDRLEAALTCAADGDATFDVATALPQLVRCGLLAGFTATKSTSQPGQQVSRANKSAELTSQPSKPVSWAKVSQKFYLELPT